MLNDSTQSETKGKGKVQVGGGKNEDSAGGRGGKNSRRKLVIPVQPRIRKGRKGGEVKNKTGHLQVDLV